MIKHSTFWWVSAALSATLVIVLLMLWMKMNQYELPQTLQANSYDTNSVIKEKWSSISGAQAGKIEPDITIKTGILFQSLKFLNSTDVNLSGYIWQRYQDGLHDDIKPTHTEVGFVLPEQVNGEFREVYRVRKGGNEEVIGWYFEATLRQQFDYSNYPFDYKTISVRLWHSFFHKNIILIPDIESYQATDVSGIFGVEQELALETWQLRDTYFDYKFSNYDTNFGITDLVAQQGFPDLHYNIVVKRKLINAFLVYLLPLFIVAVLLFIGLLTFSSDEKSSNRMGNNVPRFIGACYALLLVVILVHIQLREQFAGARIVYIEYCYILIYAMLILSTANAYLLWSRPKKYVGFILYRNNLIVKIAYWPIVISTLIVITLLCV